MAKPTKNLFRQFGVLSAVLFSPALRWGQGLINVQNRERTQLLEEMAQMRELMPLLMKQRNGYQWTQDDRQNIREHLRKLARISPYIVLFVAPGGLFLLPVMAWWWIGAGLSAMPMPGRRATRPNAINRRLSERTRC